MCLSTVEMAHSQAYLGLQFSVFTPYVFLIVENSTILANTISSNDH